jgi:hypothetical protein
VVFNDLDRRWCETAGYIVKVGPYQNIPQCVDVGLSLFKGGIYVTRSGKSAAGNDQSLNIAWRHALQLNFGYTRTLTAVNVCVVNGIAVHILI